MSKCDVDTLHKRLSKYVFKINYYLNMKTGNNVLNKTEQNWTPCIYEIFDTTKEYQIKL